jgi:hypothetical protein
MHGCESARPLRYGSLLIVAGLLVGALAAGMRGAPPPAVVTPPAPSPESGPFPVPPELIGVDLNQQSDESVAGKSATCIGCHQNAHDPHYKTTVHLGCTDCHGGDTHACGQPPPAPRQAGAPGHCPAAPPSQNPEAWHNSANPIRSYTLLNNESPEYIRFVNPGDLRVNHLSCGTSNCHGKIVAETHKSMMTHGCMLWGAALYNNGSVPHKVPRYGEFYSMNGTPLRAQTVPPPSEFELKRGVIPYLEPLPRFEMTQPGNILRIFEMGGKFLIETGIPDTKEDPGKPFQTRLSVRGLGTQTRTDPVFVGLQKTRLFDPTLNFLGTNDQPGDYRSSGCTACHMIYANDRSPIHSGPYAKYGHFGTASQAAEDDPDPTIPKNEPGHPIKHRWATGGSIPTSQCMICHIHPGTNVMNSYIGYMWYDEETDGELMYPPGGKKGTLDEFARSTANNPDEAAARGNWSDPDFLANVTDLNTQTKHTQFADFHGHGWVFRAVFKRDLKGNLLDYNGQPVADGDPVKLKAAVEMPLKIREQYRNDAASKKTPEEQRRDEAHMRAGVPMHLMDIHAEKGMHCVDCHFTQDNHGNTRLQMEVRAAIEIQCVDCHGDTTSKARLRTSGPAAYTSNPDAPNPDDPKFGRDLRLLRTPNGKPRFEIRGDKIYQNSMVEPDLTWEIVQTKDTIDPTSPRYNAKSAIAKTVRFEGDQLVWGDAPKKGCECAHAAEKMTCAACHSSWNPSCYGCHLPQRANIKSPQYHNEGDVTRNRVSYDFQTLRDEVFMLAKDGNATGNRISPARSSCAIHVGSYNVNREAIYVQQQTISGGGFSGISFSTNVPHSVSGFGTTKQCTDCHAAKNNDNNALMAQLLMQGTNYLNFIGRYCWVGAKEGGVYAVQVTEREEPQAVFGSYLHRLAFPDHYEEFVKGGSQLCAYHHPGKDVSDNLFHPFRDTEILGLQARGEYLYAACGEGGLKAYDIAFIDHKGFSERFDTAPVSPLGQRFYVNTTFATAVASPTTLAPDPTRQQFPENCEGKVHGMYGSIYVTDKYEGLIVVGAATLIDGNPLNNFLKRQATFNPDGILCGANAITIVGTYAYICCDAGLVVVSLDDPEHPQVKTVLGAPALNHPHAVQCQFRYAYVADAEGVKVLDITDLAHPVAKTKIAIADVRNLYLARTYAYLAAGKQGLVILDIENPEWPKIDQTYNAEGCINDLCDVKLGITYTSEYAYLADGKNGMRLVQLTSPDTPGNGGFSPRPTPQLIATYKMSHGCAVAISKGLDRDRAVDESGNQLGVFGRVGARPFNLQEQQKLYLHDSKLWTVSDDPAWEQYHNRLKK